MFNNFFFTKASLHVNIHNITLSKANINNLLAFQSYFEAHH